MSSEAYGLPPTAAASRRGAQCFGLRASGSWFEVWVSGFRDGVLGFLNTVWGLGLSYLIASVQACRTGLNTTRQASNLFQSYNGSPVEHSLRHMGVSENSGYLIWGSLQ